MRYILASGSPRRRELLKKVIEEYEVITADVDERAIEDKLTADFFASGKTDRRELADMLVKRLSREKATAVFEKAADKNDLVVIGSDTTVCLPDEILGKPVDREDAVRMLRKQSLSPQYVITGVSLVTKDEIRTFSETSVVVFYKLDGIQEARIQKYADTDEPYDKAGGYGIQALGDELVDHYEGSFDNIIGLPTERLKKEFFEWNKR